MRIAIDIRSAEQNQGGIPSYARNIVRSLLAAKSPHEFVLFTNALSFEENEILNSSGGAEVLQLHIPNKLLTSSIFFFQRPRLDLLVSKKLKKKIDLWFFPNINFVSLSRDVPFFVTAHDLSFEHFPSFFSRKMRAWHATVRPETLFTRATHIIAVSNATKNDLIATYGLNPKRISVIYHGITPSFSAMPQTTRKELDVPEKYILVSAAASKRKNLLMCINAFQMAKQTYKSLRDYKLLVTGMHGGLPLADSVVSVGFLSDEKYRAVLQYAECLIYPSFFEGFGLPLVEAFAARVPVIASAHSSLCEIGQDAFYPIDPYDTSSLVHGIHAVLQDENLRSRLVQRGLARVGCFSWEAAASQLLKAFEKYAPI